MTYEELQQGLLNDSIRPYPEFPFYYVSRKGSVYSKTGNKLTPRKNNGSLHHNYILMLIEGKQVVRSVGKVVATTFISKVPFENIKGQLFDYVIYLDRNFDNVCVENLAWRPLWFAQKYHSQFKYDKMLATPCDLTDISTGERFSTIREVCVRYGALADRVFEFVYGRTTDIPIVLWPSQVELRRNN